MPDETPHEASDNRIIAPDKLERQGLVSYRLGGTRNTVTLDGIRFSPKTSTSLLILTTGNNGVITIGRLRRAIGVTVRAGEKSHLRIGTETSFRRNVTLHASDGCTIEIGEDCMFSSNIMVRSTDSHGIFDRSSGVRINPDEDIVIGSHVWVGEGCKILKGARIGEGCVIGAGSVISGTVPAHCVVVGSPARVVRENIRWER